MDDLISDFISETSENLLNLDNELVELEENPDNADLIGKIFRVMHTIKGTCGFLGLNKLASVAHAAENILDKMRSKNIPVNSKNISALLEAVDTIKTIVSYIQENDGAEPQEEYGWLIDKIENTLNQEDPIKTATPSLSDLDKLFGNKALGTPALDISQIMAAPSASDNKTATVVENIATSQPVANTVSPKPDQPPANQAAQVKQASSVIDDEANQAIRVKLEVLDDLMQNVSELVLTRNQLLQLDRVIHDDSLSSCLQNLNFITTSIQEIVMSTRMQPISNAWIKVPRMIRDLSKDLNKKIKLEMIGKETELDRQLIESIKDPLVHMIRNSADHGLESEEVRIANGKPAEGTITLQAYHSSGSIIIEVSDDGAGIDIPKVKSKIIEKGLATESEVNQLTEPQLIQYIFRAGFSTNDKVTALSGRGVGMDVVKTNIESIRGTVEIKSVSGKGSTFILKIPLTLAIMPILVVEVRNQKFGIPQSSILEMLRVGNDTTYKVEEMNEHLILRLRESLIPLVKLSEVLKLSDNKNEDKKEEDYYVVVCEIRGNSFGIIVDNIYDTEEIVLKPLPKILESINIYSGTTLLGNGDIILILAPNGIAQNISLLSAEESSFVKNEEGYASAIAKFLVLKCNNVFKAVPLELVLRLEEIDVNKIEFIGNKKVIQYMNSLMYLSKLDPDYVIPKNGKQQIVVFADSEHILGLVVEKIIDIVSQNVDENLAFDQSNPSALVLADKTMDIIDINDYFKEFLFDQDNEMHKANNKYKILLAEESPYFLKFLLSVLKMEGFDVVAARTGEEVLNIIDDSEYHFDILITDISFKNIDGVSIAKAVAQSPKANNTLLIGLTSNLEEINQSSEDLAITNFAAKSNSEELMKLVYSLLNSRKQVQS